MTGPAVAPAAWEVPVVVDVAREVAVEAEVLTMTEPPLVVVLTLEVVERLVLVVVWVLVEAEAEVLETEETTEEITDEAELWALTAAAPTRARTRVLNCILNVGGLVGEN